MKIISLQKHTHQINKWDGGTTHELFILPAIAAYADRNFQLRISKAYIQKPESDFTLLPGINRNLLLLEGSMLLHINRKKYQLLLPADEIHFEGGIPIHCKGSGVDYNVMWKGEGEVSSQVLHMETHDHVMLDQSIGGQMLFFHLHRGKVEIEILGEVFKLNAGGSLVIDALREDLNLMVYATAASDLILSEILLHKAP